MAGRCLRAPSKNEVPLIFKLPRPTLQWLESHCRLLGVVEQACNPSTVGGRGRQLAEF